MPQLVRGLELSADGSTSSEPFKSSVSQPYGSPGEAIRKMGVSEWQNTRPISSLSNDKEAKDQRHGGFFRAGLPEVVHEHDC